MASEGGVLEPSDVKMSLSRPEVRLVEDLWTCSVLKLSHTQGYRYHLSKFHMLKMFEFIANCNTVGLIKCEALDCFTLQKISKSIKIFKSPNLVRYDPEF